MPTGARSSVSNMKDPPADPSPTGTIPERVSKTPPASEVLQIWPLLFVRDIEQSMDFYCGKLGFRVVGMAKDGGTAHWCRVARGGAALMLQQADPPASAVPTGSMSLYFVCDDADALFEEFSTRGIRLDRPTIAVYGMKQLFVPEPNGYDICFESPTEQWSG